MEHVIWCAGPSGHGQSSCSFLCLSPKIHPHTRGDRYHPLGGVDRLTSRMAPLCLVCCLPCRFMALAKNYIDDRLIGSPTLLGLMQAWHNTQQLEEAQGWQTNLSKTVVLTTHPLPSEELIPGLALTDTFPYLGHDIRIVPSAQRTVLAARVHKAKHTSRKITQLPPSLSVRIRSALIVSVLTPQWSYGFLTAPPPKSVTKQLEQCYRSALWHRHKNMHSWPANLALAYDPTPHSAWGSMVFRHLMTLARSLQHCVTACVRMLWNDPPPGLHFRTHPDCPPLLSTDRTAPLSVFLTPFGSASGPLS